MTPLFKWENTLHSLNRSHLFMKILVIIYSGVGTLQYNVKVLFLHILVC